MFNLLEATPNTVIGNVIVASGAFIILIVLIRVFAWKQITGIFEQRAKKISDDIDSAEESKVEAAKLVAQRENELAGSKEEAANIIQTANDTAAQNRTKIVAQANEEVAIVKKNVLKMKLPKNAKKRSIRLKVMLLIYQ